MLFEHESSQVVCLQLLESLLTESVTRDWCRLSTLLGRTYFMGRTLRQQGVKLVL